jgi:riboflavin biosynthesis pyrimidine reductase
LSDAGLRLERLFESPSLPAFELPARLAETYGGTLGIDKPSVFANFVASVEGTVALPGERESGRIISLASRADRFVMGLLRGFADVILIGAGTYAKARRALWTPAHICPELEPDFAELRQRLQLAPQPRLAIVSGSGKLDPGPALEQALVLTTQTGEAELRRSLPSSAEVVVLPGERLGAEPVMRHLRQNRFERILSEGGPQLFGELVRARVVDELFLTVSPQLFGRSAGDGKKAIIDGVDMDAAALELTSLRRHGSHLFTRYSFGARRMLTIDT